MDQHSLWIILHVLLLVFWLGTDVGVFLAAKISERGDLSTETRMTVLKLGMSLDRLPRSALTLIVPSGLMLAVPLGLLAIPAWGLTIAWLVGLAWLGILWLGFLRPETPTEQRAMLINFAMNAIMALLVCGYALYLLFMTDTATWLAIKVLVTGLVFVTGVMLDVLFKPAVVAFMAIASEGGSPERDSAYSKAIGPVYTAVLVIYALVLIATVMGIAKPF